MTQTSSKVCHCMVGKARDDGKQRPEFNMRESVEADWTERQRQGTGRAPGGRGAQT